MVNTSKLGVIANVLRRDVVEMTFAAGSGHLTSCLSAAEIVSALFFDVMKYDTKNAYNPDNDEFILSKGHAAPLLYAALERTGCIEVDLLKLRKFDSVLEGHPIPSGELSWIKVATGSLGQGLGVGVGMALAGKLQQRKFRTYVLLGDSECSEGSVWEAAELASYYKLNNLIAIIDVNKLGQRGETMLGYDLKTYAARFKAFGWQTIIVDGHNITEIVKALATKNALPLIIIAKTVKGKGISFIEGKNGWHGKVLNKQDYERALNEIKLMPMPAFDITKPKGVARTYTSLRVPKSVNYHVGDMMATREAYGRALARLCADNKSVITIDGEVSNSTYADMIKETSPKQFLEAYIAEQNMISMALGLSVKNQKVFASTFAVFLSRAHDQLRMAALSKADFVVCGSHAGVSIGEDGPSQMGLEDIAMFRGLLGATILQPADAVSAEKIVFEAAKISGLVYIRTTRPKVPVIYDNHEEFPVGDFKILRQSFSDKVVLAGTGITVHEALKAQQILVGHGIHAAVVDLYSIEPFPKEKLLHFVKTHGNCLVVAEDHYVVGGLGERTCAELTNNAINCTSLAVNKIPHSGTKDELLEHYGIDYKAIIKKVLFILSHKHYS